MAKYYIIGNYTAQAFKGFIKDPKQDRAAAANALATALDAKMESFQLQEDLMILLDVLAEKTLSQWLQLN